MSDDELAFYDALETNDSAVHVLGDETLCVIARELVRTVRANVTIDWTLRENVRANLRRLVKRILRKYGYPPDKQETCHQYGYRAGGDPVGGLGGLTRLVVCDMSKHHLECRRSGIRNLADFFPQYRSVVRRWRFT